MKTITNVCYLTPNNFQHKAGDGTITRKRNIRYIHPALQANCGATQCTYLLVKIKCEKSEILNHLYDYYNQKFRNDFLSGTITTNSNFSGSGVMLVFERMVTEYDNGENQTSN